MLRPSLPAAYRLLPTFLEIDPNAKREQSHSHRKSDPRSADQAVAGAIDRAVRKLGTGGGVWAGDESQVQDRRGRGPGRGLLRGLRSLRQAGRGDRQVL